MKLNAFSTFKWGLFSKTNTDCCLHSYLEIQWHSLITPSKIMYLLLCLCDFMLWVILRNDHLVTVSYSVCMCLLLIVLCSFLLYPCSYLGWESLKIKPDVNACLALSEIWLKHHYFALAVGPDSSRVIICARLLKYEIQPMNDACIWLLHSPYNTNPGLIKSSTWGQTLSNRTKHWSAW